MAISPQQLDDLAKSLPGMGKSPQEIRQRVEALEMLLERSLHIPGTRIPIGLDSIIGLIPVLGDLITTAMGAYLIWEARNLGMSKWQLVRMTANVGVDTVIGAIPLLAMRLTLSGGQTARTCGSSASISTSTIPQPA